MNVKLLLSLALFVYVSLGGALCQTLKGSNLVSYLVNDYKNHLDYRDRKDTACYDIVVLKYRTDTLIGVMYGKPNVYWKLFLKKTPILHTTYRERDVNIYVEDSLNPKYFQMLFDAERVNVPTRKRQVHQRYSLINDYEIQWFYYRLKSNEIEEYGGTTQAPMNIHFPTDEEINTLYIEDDE